MADERFTELLTKKLSGEISPAELAEFNGLLRNNPDLQREYDAIKGYWVENDPTYENTVSIFEKIKQRAGITDSDYVTKPGLRSRKIIYAAAASLLLLISATPYLLRLNKKAEPLAELTTGNGAITHVRLPDGTFVTLNEVSVLKYPKTFKGGKREVYLSGEGFFDVAKDQAHPFIVHTGRSDIQVLGTTFNVKCYDNDSLLEATLFSGSIQASVKTPTCNQILLKPSEKLVVTDSGYHLAKGTHLDADTTNIETAWMQNKIIFKDQPFGLLANSLSRRYGVNVIFEKESLRSIKLTGEFGNEDINRVMLSLKLVTNFNYRIAGDNIYIY
jgi:transmembrane sensor